MLRPFDLQIVASGKDFAIINSGRWAVQIFIEELEDGTCHVVLQPVGNNFGERAALGMSGQGRETIYMSNSVKKMELIRQGVDLARVPI